MVVCVLMIVVIEEIFVLWLGLMFCMVLKVCVVMF